MSNRLLLLCSFVLYFMMIGSVFADEVNYCTDDDARTYYDIRTETTSSPITPQFPLSVQGKEIIAEILSTKVSTDIFPERVNDQAICAGYLHDLSQIFWGPTSVSRIGMYHPQKRDVCSAWELPYCYWYRGGEVMSDLGDAYGPQLKKDPTSFLDLVSQEDLLRWFASAWNWKAYLGDLTFVFRESQYLHMIGEYGNYNSHIGKNIGVSQFTLPLRYDAPGVSNQLMMREALGCSEDMWKIIEPVWQHYEMTLNGKLMRYVSNDEVVARQDDGQRDRVKLQAGDNIEYKDVTMVHFWEGEKVESLIEFICDEEFFPVAVVGINEKLIGKE